MRDAAYRHLLSLLPPGRYPREGGYADGIVRALGGLEARLVEEFLEAAKTAFPHTAPEPALEEIARARGLRRLPWENTEVFRERVRNALLFWKRAGTKRGLEEILSELGFRAQVVEYRGGEGFQERVADGTWYANGEARATGAPWAEFLLRVEPQGAFTDPERILLLTLARELKPAHTRLYRLEVALRIPGPVPARVLFAPELMRFPTAAGVEAPLLSRQALAAGGRVGLEPMRFLAADGEVPVYRAQSALRVGRTAAYVLMRFPVADGAMLAA